MNDSPNNPERHYTWADYVTWDDSQRWEIIRGKPYLMSPSPSSRHQIVVRELCRQMANYFHRQACTLFVSPMDVRLSDEDIVQPDLMVVCDPKQVALTHIEGPPALAVEILSSQSATRDRLLKLDLYAEAGVKEYWIVTPWPALVEILVLDGRYFRVHKVFGKDQTLVSPTFPELKVQLGLVFDFPLEPGEEPLHEPPPPPYRTGSPALPH